MDIFPFFIKRGKNIQIGYMKPEENLASEARQVHPAEVIGIHKSRFV